MTTINPKHTQLPAANAAPVSSNTRSTPATTPAASNSFSAADAPAHLISQRGADWTAFAGGATGAPQAPMVTGALPQFNFPSLPNPSEILRNFMNAGFEQYRQWLAGPITVSEDVESISGLPMGRDGRFDGQGDALKHVLHAALIHYIDPNVSPALLQGKEYFQGNVQSSPEASIMDRHNNNVGFQIGQSVRDAVAGNPALTDADAPRLIIEEVISRFRGAEGLGPNGDQDTTSQSRLLPYWEKNHGFATLDEAAPGWDQRARDFVVANSERSLETNFPWQ